ncbi:Uncharacterised protein [Yersinia frederiksenii]|nr:Uncharacterised protein [Yersinia frederiksenii]
MDLRLLMNCDDSIGNGEGWQKSKASAPGRRGSSLQGWIYGVFTIGLFSLNDMRASIFLTTTPTAVGLRDLFRCMDN